MNYCRAVSCDTPAARPASPIPSPARIPPQNASRTSHSPGRPPLTATLPSHQERRNDPEPKLHLGHDYDARGAVGGFAALSADRGALSAGLQPDPKRDGRSLWRLAVWAVMEDGVQ